MGKPINIILPNMGIEIMVLEQRRGKSYALKQAMRQEHVTRMARLA